jgi:hypothetical protein
MSGLKCPNCGTPAAFTPIYITRGEVFHYVIGTKEAATHNYVVPVVMPQSLSGSGIRYAILCCQECESLFVVKELSDGKGWFVVYPIQHKAVAKEIPEPIKGEFEEANLCFATGAHLACLLMCKTVVIALQRQQNVSNLKQLEDKGTISKTLYEQADEVRLWANIIGHEDIVPESVTKEDCEQLLAYVEAVLNAIYVEPARFGALKQKREQMKKKTAG